MRRRWTAVETGHSARTAGQYSTRSSTYDGSGETVLRVESRSPAADSNGEDEGRLHAHSGHLKNDTNPKSRNESSISTARRYDFGNAAVAA